MRINHSNGYPEYMDKVQEKLQVRQLQPGTVTYIAIRHDDWCDLLAGRGECNCDPEVQILGREQ